MADVAPNESLPLPVPLNVPYVTTSNFMNVAYGNTEDKKDIGVYGAYVSSGTKYAVFFREASSGRFKYGYTTTLPTSTVTSVVLGDISMDSIIGTGLQLSSATVSSVLGFDSSKNIVSTKYPTTPSYGSCYISIYTRINMPTPNVWYNAAGSWLAGSCSSQWSLATPTPNFGLKYTGPNAIVKITYTINSSGFAAGFATIAVGSGTPVPIESAAESAVGLDTRMTYIQKGDADGSTTGSIFTTTINTNDSIIFYSAGQSTGSDIFDVVSGGFSALVLSYV